MPKIKNKKIDIIDVFVFIILLILVDNFFCNNAYSFELDKNDRWYYEMPSWKGIGEAPDKYTHFYRSYFVTQIVDIKYVLISNILYELDNERIGVGFSYKDLIADTLGAIAGTLYKKDSNINLFLDWNREDKNIILNFVYVF